ncbi:MAG: hypothetical protein ABIL50_00065 [candidate division WOR-3 bacterium]
MILAVYWFSGCRKDAGSGPDTGGGRDTLTLGGNPEIVSKTAINSGADLQIVWRSVESAEGYKVYCDGNQIWSGTNTTYTIVGADNVCRIVEVSAFRGSDERKTYIDLTPLSNTITGLVSHDGTGNSWVKIDFSTGDISSTRLSSVDPNAPNTGWFVFYNNAGNPEFRDASATSVGSAKMEMAFTPSSSGYLAPGTGNYNTVRGTNNGAYHFFWADNTTTGYGSMDNNDYFGVIMVTSLTGIGPYRADLEIYVQNKVPGLRWVKF